MSDKEAKEKWQKESGWWGVLCCVVGWFILGGPCAVLAIIFGATATKSSDPRTRAIGIIDIVIGSAMALIVLMKLAM